MRYDQPGQPGGLGLPPGWTEHVIGDTFSDADGQVKVGNAIALDANNATVLDKGRTYFYKEQTGEISWVPPKGSAMLAQEVFLHFGRVTAKPLPVQ